MADEREPSTLLVDPEDDDAVVPAVGAIDEAAVGRDLDVRAVVLRRRLLGNGRLAVDEREFSRCGIERVRTDRGVELVDDEGETAARMEGHVTRSRARRGRGFGYFFQAAVVADAVGDQLVEAEVGGNGQ